MKISVFTVGCQAEATIGLTVASFPSQDSHAKEMLAIDGAAADDTVAVAKSFGSPHVRVLSDPHCGINDALKKALAIYESVALGVLNAGDRLRRAQR